MIPQTFITFERGDRVRIKGARLEYTIVSIDLHGDKRYDPEFADAVITGGGIQRTIPVNCLELAV